MRRAEAGFTLIETLVALVIFIACYLLLQQSVSLAWRGVQVAHGEAAALQIAQARLAAAGVDARLEEGEQSGRTPEGFGWTQRMRRYAPPRDDEAQPRLAGYWVTVEVSWQEGAWRRSRSLRLATLKLGAQP
jgi:type II secretory pathway pseudopilin PulG